VALFERTVGIYAELINVNAYHQPGVEAGKKGAKAALGTLRVLEGRLDERFQTVRELAPEGSSLRLVWRLLDHLAATGRAEHMIDEDDPFGNRYRRPIAT
jgi:glucose-6-phosphate isomerase